MITVGSSGVQSESHSSGAPASASYPGHRGNGWVQECRADGRLLMSIESCLVSICAQAGSEGPRRAAQAAHPSSATRIAGSPSLPSARYFLVARLYVASAHTAGASRGTGSRRRSKASLPPGSDRPWLVVAASQRTLSARPSSRLPRAPHPGRAPTWLQVCASHGHAAGHDAPPGGLRGVELEAHARHLREAPLQLGPLADAVFKGSHQLGACHQGAVARHRTAWRATSEHNKPSDSMACHLESMASSRMAVDGLRQAYAKRRAPSCAAGAGQRASQKFDHLSPAGPTCDLDLDRVIEHGQDATQVAVGQLARGVDAVCSRQAQQA